MIKYKRIVPPRDDGMKWVCTETYRIYYKRYGKWLEIREGDMSDGASGALDIRSSAWWGHDWLCKHGTFQDGTPVTAWMAANCLRDILREEGRLLRSYYWHWATFLFGCKRTRKNGWFTHKRGF